MARAPEVARPDLARRALLAEGIALHFLEDSFSAGHYAATWGDAAWQKGTHDLYCVQGLTSKTWGGDLFASHGDAHMTGHDQAVAGAVVGRSLSQLAGAASGTVAVSAAPPTKAERELEDLDFCQVQSLPAMAPDPVAYSAALVTLEASPIPSGDQDDIHPPRARADIGLFGGVVAGIGAGPAWGGFDTSAGWRFRSELEVGARFGYGLQGVLTTNMDGQLWAQASFVSDPAQLDASCPGCPGGARSNQALPRVPARSALKLVFRMPYYVIPFDLILLGPALLLASPVAAQDVVFKATGGGLWTLQRPISTSLGTFQFMAGREIGFTLWGWGTRTSSWPRPPTGRRCSWTSGSSSSTSPSSSTSRPAPSPPRSRWRRRCSWGSACSSRPRPGSPAEQRAVHRARGELVGLPPPEARRPQVLRWLPGGQLGELTWP